MRQYDEYMDGPDATQWLMPGSLAWLLGVELITLVPRPGEPMRRLGDWAIEEHPRGRNPRMRAVRREGVEEPEASGELVAEYGDEGAPTRRYARDILAKAGVSHRSLAGMLDWAPSTISNATSAGWTKNDTEVHKQIRRDIELMLAIRKADN